MPVAGAEYPRTWHEFEEWFPDDSSCAAFVEKLRWPDGFVCPSCAHVSASPHRAERGHRLLCPECRHQTSATTGTIFEKTRTPLRTWFAAAWYMTNQKSGCSALGLRRALGLGSYQTAWAMLHRYRRAMVRPGRERLSGSVEVDETYVGGLEKGVRGRETKTKSIVVIGVEVLQPKGFGRIRLRTAEDVAGPSLTAFVVESVQPGSTVLTDGWASYGSLAALGYIHRTHVVATSGHPAHVALPGVHRVASLLKRWLLGTHQGAVSPWHLDEYLNEFVFRFNRRSSRARGLLFYRLLEQAVVAPPATYREIVDPAPATLGTPSV